MHFFQLSILVHLTITLETSGALLTFCLGGAAFAELKGNAI